MDKISKSLKKFTKKELDLIKSALRDIQAGKMLDLDIKKLKNRDDIFRVRKSRIRIIYKKKNKKIKILAIERRSETTYKNI